MTRRGFTLIEMLMVIVIIGAVGVIMFPRLSGELNRQNVRSARQAITALHARARASAIQRARATSLIRDGNEIRIESRHPVTGAVDTIGTPLDVSTSHGGVAMTWTRDVLTFDPRGIGIEGTSTRIIVSRPNFADTLVISAVGSIVQ